MQGSDSAQKLGRLGGGAVELVAGVSWIDLSHEDAIVHATRIAARDAGLRGQQVANIAGTRESGSKPRLSDATSLYTMAQ